MNDLGKEYGTALFSLAAENDKKEEYFDCLQKILKVFAQNGEYVSFLSSKSIPKQERIKCVDEVFGEDIGEYVLSFLKLLIEKGEISSFFEAEKTYSDLFKASKHILSVTVKSAVELSQEQRQSLKQKLEKKYGCKTQIDYKIVPELLGGIVVETSDNVLDGSIISGLQQLKEVISQ